MANSHTTILALSVLCLTACASPLVMTRPGGSQIGFAQDRYQCQQETASFGNYSAFGAPLFVAIAQGQAQKRQQAMFVSCMQARGYMVVRH